MDFLIDVLKLTSAIVVSVIVVIVIKRFFSKLLEPLFELVENKCKNNKNDK